MYYVSTFFKPYIKASIGVVRKCIAGIENLDKSGFLMVEFSMVTGI
jgi:hypothetical protein